MCCRDVDLGAVTACIVLWRWRPGRAAEARQGRATDRSNLRVTSGPLARRPICLSSIIESNGVGDSTWLNKIFHICAIVNLVTTISVGRLRIEFISGILINQPS